MDKVELKMLEDCGCLKDYELEYLKLIRNNHRNKYLNKKNIVKTRA